VEKKGRKDEEEGNALYKSQIRSGKMTTHNPKANVTKIRESSPSIGCLLIMEEFERFLVFSLRVLLSIRSVSFYDHRLVRYGGENRIKNVKIDGKSNVQWNAELKVGRTIMEAPSSLNWLAEL
jgi:hypothetical protein